MRQSRRCSADRVVGGPSDWCRDQIDAPIRVDDLEHGCCCNGARTLGDRVQGRTARAGDGLGAAHLVVSDESTWL